MSFREMIARILYIGTVGAPGIIAYRLWNSEYPWWLIASTVILFVLFFVVLLRNVMWTLDQLDVNKTLGWREALITNLVITSVASSFLPAVFVFLGPYSEVIGFMILLMLGAVFISLVPRFLIKTA